MPANRPARPAGAKKGLFDLEAATKEIQEKDILEIERATAITWGGRAAASYQLAATATGVDQTRRLQDAENYRQEAIEHAAMTDDLEFLVEVRNEMETFRRKAIAATT